MNMIYQQDHVKLDAGRITEYKHPAFGDTTVFHDVVIASEIVQPYDDGKAWKPREELEAYAWTVDGAWVVVGAHPAEGIVSDRGQVSGRTVKPRYVKDLLDPKTNRPCRAGVRADVEIFNRRVPASTLEDMKNGKKQDVSIGFFFSKDEVSGTITDGPCKGDTYDYIQRNMFHNHLAAGIDNGRCPMPFCGLGADELNKNLVGDPFAGFSDFKDCIKKIKEKNPELSDESAKKICGSLKAKHEKKNKEDMEDVKIAAKALLKVMEELKALEGERDAMETTQKTEWWREINWSEDANRTIFSVLNEDIRDLIIEAGLCPECQDNKNVEDMSLEDINGKITELQNKRKELKDKIDEYWKEQEKKQAEKTPVESPTRKLWDEIYDLDKELEVLFNAKSFKLAIGDEMTDIDGYEQDYVETDAQMSYKAKSNLPDSEYAYIEEGCKKEDGKTQQSCRHMPINDPAHVRAALAALGGARSGKIPSYADKAKPKVCAAAKKFKIESEICKPKKKDTLDPYEVMRRADDLLKPE